MKKKDYLMPSLDVNGLLMTSILSGSNGGESEGGDSPGTDYDPNPTNIGGKGNGDSSGTATGGGRAKEMTTIFNFD